MTNLMNDFLKQTDFQLAFRSFVSRIPAIARLESGAAGVCRAAARRSPTPGGEGLAALEGQQVRRVHRAAAVAATLWWGASPRSLEIGRLDVWVYRRQYGTLRVVFQTRLAIVGCFVHSW